MANIWKAFYYASAIVIIGSILTVLLKPVTFEASSPFKVYVINEQVIHFTPLFWTIAVVGGCIVLTLTYVSWKKYKAEKKERKKDKTFD